MTERRYTVFGAAQTGHLHELAQVVNEKMEEGWRPIGAPFIQGNGFNQTMVRDDGQPKDRVWAVGRNDRDVATHVLELEAIGYRRTGLSKKVGAGEVKMIHLEMVR